MPDLFRLFRLFQNYGLWRRQTYFAYFARKETWQSITNKAMYGCEPQRTVEAPVREVSSELAFDPKPSLSFFEDALSQWIHQHCCFRNCCWGGVKALHRHYQCWCTKDVMDIPCSLTRFTEWLRNEECYLTDFGLMNELTLKVDLIAARIPFTE